MVEPWTLTEAQDIYDAVCAYLVARTEGRAGRGGRLGEEFFCQYRSETGPCAVGLLIADSEWADGVVPGEVSGTVLDLLGEERMLRPEARERLRRHQQLLVDLQSAHDDPGSWWSGRLSEDGRRELRRVAVHHRLEVRWSE